MSVPINATLSVHTWASDRLPGVNCVERPVKIIVVRQHCDSRESDVRRCISGWSEGRLALASTSSTTKLALPMPLGVVRQL